MVLGAKSVRSEVKFIPLRFVEATAVPVPLGNPFVKLYSTPYAVNAEQPLDGMLPAKVADEVVIADEPPVVTVGTELTPAPVAATLIAFAPAQVLG